MYKKLVINLCSSTSKFPYKMSSYSFFLLFWYLSGCSLQAQGLCRFQQFPPNYEVSPTFLLGLIIMLAGFALNYKSDTTLLTLRQSGRYQIPHGHLFEYVSSPHFLGEIIEWWGFCIACQGSWASLSFAVWTSANLVPRAVAQHQWYFRAQKRKGS